MKNIFRRSTLENMATPEQLDQQIVIMRPHAWIFLAAAVVIFISLGAWAFYGNISSTVNIEGIVFPQAGVSFITAELTGNVNDVLYAEGDEVISGDIIAVIPNAEVLDELKEAKQELERQTDAVRKKQIENHIEELQEYYMQTSIIRADSSGTIQKIVSINQNINTGEEIASILVNNQSSNNRQIIGYIPLVTANQLQTGMEAQVCPAYVSREEYGYMKGYVSYIGTMPVTNESMKKYYGNLEYVSDILPDSSCVEIRISLNMDENSKNLFKWSNAKGNDLTVDIGTICNILIIRESKSPISLLLK